MIYFGNVFGAVAEHTCKSDLAGDANCRMIYFDKVSGAISSSSFRWPRRTSWRRSKPYQNRSFWEVADHPDPRMPESSILITFWMPFVAFPSQASCPLASSLVAARGCSRASYWYCAPLLRNQICRMIHLQEASKTLSK